MTAIATAEVCRISAGTLLELSIVIDSQSDAIAQRGLDDLITRQRILVEDVTPYHVALGRAAYRDFGKGSDSPAQLNFGDCFAYALARETGEPLLYKGDDFGHTDLRAALPQST